MTPTWTCRYSDSCSPTDALPREKSAVHLLVTHLREEGSDVTGVCSPERHPCELRVDAPLTIDGVAWMVDHMPGLILDQREGEVEYFPVANGIFASGTVTQCLEDLLGETPDRLDAAWFIDSWATISQVR